MEKIVIIGCGGHAHSLLDSIESSGKYEVAGFVGKELDVHFRYKNYPMIGTDSQLEELFAQGIKNAAVGIGFLGKGCVRDSIYEALKSIGFQLPAIVDPTAMIADQVIIEEGVFVAKRAVVNTGAKIGRMSIVNTGAIVEHDAVVGEFSHIAVAAVLCGETHIGRKCLIGANAVVIQCRNIGDHVIVGAGSVVTKDVETYKVYINSGTDVLCNR